VPTKSKLGIKFPYVATTAFRWHYFPKEYVDHDKDDGPSSLGQRQKDFKGQEHASLNTVHQLITYLHNLNIYLYYFNLNRGTGAYFSLPFPFCLPCLLSLSLDYIDIFISIFLSGTLA
jgi:hypothetical protein